MKADKIPGYKTLRLLGRGGMGSVYLAQREATGQTVALKISKGSLGEHGIARLRREADLLSRIESPYLPKFVEAAELENGNFLLAMDFVRGDPLQVYVVSEDEPEDRLEMLRRALPGIAKGLLALHEAGIIHRDMKPANVIINARRAIVVDLGLARGPDVMTLTKTGAAVGTPEYMPPEQITGEAAGPAADLYQVGLIARDLLLGSRRTAGKDMVQDAMRRAISRPEDLRAAAGWIPPEVAEWIQACLHPTPAGRPDPSEHLQKGVLLCQQGMAPVGSVGDVPEEPTWLGSDAHQKVLTARKQAEAQGWPEAGEARVPSWVGGGPAEAGAGAPAPVVAAAGAAPPPRSGVAWVLGVVGVVLGLGLGLGFAGGGAPGSAAAPSPEIVLTREGDRLAILEGPADLRMVEPVEAAFELGQSGRRSVAAPEGPFTLASEGLGGEWHAMAAKVTEIRDVALLRDSLWVHLGPGEAPERVRFHWGKPEREWRTPGSGWQRAPPELLDQPQIRVSSNLGPNLWLEHDMDMVGLLRDLNSRLGELPQGDTSSNTYGIPDGTYAWMGENGLRIAALLSSSAGIDGIREARYRSLAPSIHEEFLTKTSPLRATAVCSSVLGPDLAITDTSMLVASTGSGPRAVTPKLMLEWRIGRHHRVRGPMPVQTLAGRRASLEVLQGDLARLSIPGFDRSLPLAADISVHGTSFEGRTRLRLEVAGHQLFLPAAEPIFWRTHRIPPEWFRAAVSQDGEFSFDLSLDHSEGFEPAPDGRIGSVQVTAIYPR